MSLNRLPSTSHRVLRATVRAVVGFCAILVLPVYLAGGDAGDLVDRIGDRAIELGILGAIALWWLFYWCWRRVHGQRVAQAAAIAASDDPDFAAEVVRGSAAELFERIQEAWDAADRDALEALTSPELFGEWSAVLDEHERRGIRHHVKVVELTSVEYLGIVNLEGERGDRVTLRICSRRLDFYVGRDGKVLPYGDVSRYERRASKPEENVWDRAEYWTLAKRADGDGWVLDSIAEDEKRRDVLGAEIVALPPDRAFARAD